MPVALWRDVRPWLQRLECRRRNTRMHFGRLAFVCFLFVSCPVGASARLELRGYDTEARLPASQTSLNQI